jgi:hypothetical protein
MTMKWRLAMTNNTFITYTVTGDISDLQRFRLAFEREWNAFKKLDGQSVSFSVQDEDRFVSPSMIKLVRDAVAPPSVRDIQAMLGPAHRDLYSGAPKGLARRERVEAVKRSLFGYSRESAEKAIRTALARSTMRKAVNGRLNTYRPGRNAFLDLAMDNYGRARR